MDHAPPPKIAFIGHPTDLQFFHSYMQFLRPDKTFRDELLLKLFEWTPSYAAHHWEHIRIDNEQTFDGVMIMVPFLPEMKDIKLKQVNKKIEHALSIAASEKCTVAAMGAFCSIVLQGKESELAQKYRMAITSGNTFTAATIIGSLEELTRKFDWNMHELTLGIIGASGDIGSGCTAYFGDKVKKMILTARGKAAIESMVQRNEAYITCDIEVADTNRAAVDQSDILIIATSAYSQLFTMDDFRSGTIVCDASAPQNIQWNKKLRPDCFMYHGGIVSLPVSLQPGFDLGLAAPYFFYGCQTEAIFMALDPALPPSWGRGNITREKIDRYLATWKRSFPSITIVYSIGDKVYTVDEIHAYRTMFCSRAKGYGGNTFGIQSREQI